MVKTIGNLAAGKNVTVVMTKEEAKAEAEVEVELSEVKPLVHNPEAKEVKAGFKYAKNGNKAMNNIFAKFNK